MIIKKREIPLTILKLEALLRRLPPHHPKIPIIEEELKKRFAGFKGESSLDFSLGFLEEKDYFIFHDIRLEDQSRFFQIDTLLLTQKIDLIIEVKNMAGTVYFDPIFKQLIQTKDGKEKAFPYPITQLERQELQLKRWFINNRLKEVAISSLIVFSNPQTIIRTPPGNSKISQKVIHRELLPAKIKEIEKLHRGQEIEKKDLKKTIRHLLKQHREADFPILKQFKISENEVLKGVICSDCNHIPLIRVHGSWFCPKCHSKNKDDHINALKDYRLLFKPTITNSQLRDFLIITSTATSSRILQSMNLTYSGMKKNRVYNLSFDK